MPLITLKIDVDTYRGTREGVPNLVRLLTQHQAPATFLFSLGPDHTGWALRRVFRPGFFQKVSRTSVVEHYGIRTLLYGWALPGPDIGRQCAEEMRATARAGFECGIHTWDHVYWQDNVRQRDERWTQRQMQQAFDRFGDIFGTSPHTHGAAGWQMNAHAFGMLDQLGMAYASDGRARLDESGALMDANVGPCLLTAGHAGPFNCVQLPTTLPTLDELLGREINGTMMDASSVARHVLSLTERPRDHVFTLHAELEGQKLAPIFDTLLRGWAAQGYTFASMRDHYATVDRATLPTQPIRWGELPGRSGEWIIH